MSRAELCRAMTDTSDRIKVGQCALRHAEAYVARLRKAIADDERRLATLVKEARLAGVTPMDIEMFSDTSMNHRLLHVWHRGLDGLAKESKEARRCAERAQAARARRDSNLAKAEVHLRRAARFQKSADSLEAWLPRRRQLVERHEAEARRDGASEVEIAEARGDLPWETQKPRPLPRGQLRLVSAAEGWA